MQYPTIAQPQYGFAPTMPMMPSMSDMPPAMMAKGGLASAAQNVQAQGRGDDSMLVHMTPGEVGGLQALAMQHGGSLSINPNTGLPEAGFLKNILPTVLGFALTPFMGPLAAGLTVGGIETVRTGDIGKGFLAGLGAYGGANLAGSLQAAGTAANAANAANVAGADALTAAGTNAFEGAATALTPTQQLTTGAQNIFASGPAGDAARTAAMGNLGGYSGLATQAGLAAAPTLLAQPEVKPIEPEKSTSTYEGPYVPTPRDVRFPTADQQKDLGTSEFQYFKDVNPVPGFQPFSATQTAQATPTTLPSTSSGLLTSLTDEEKRRMMGETTPFMAAKGGVPTLEDGGFVLTKKAVDGLGKGDNKKGQQVASRGLGAIPIKGPGTGTSDSIKTSIDGKRPALVSNGEAYVPKKQVAKHGGAKKFYALMSKAEKAAEKRKRA